MPIKIKIIFEPVSKYPNLQSKLNRTNTVLTQGYTISNKTVIKS